MGVTNPASPWAEPCLAEVQKGCLKRMPELPCGLLAAAPSSVGQARLPPAPAGLEPRPAGAARNGGCGLWLLRNGA
jgi:hypothetical protein